MTTTAAALVPQQGGSETKHSPGPWRFDHDWSRLPTIFGADGKHIAIIEKDRPQSEREANALIATAAPEMLAVLKTVKVARVGNKVFIGIITEDGCWSAEMTEECGRDMALEWEATRRAAVARATGAAS